MGVLPWFLCKKTQFVVSIEWACSHCHMAELNLHIATSGHSPGPTKLLFLSRSSYHVIIHKGLRLEAKASGQEWVTSQPVKSMLKTLTYISISIHDLHCLMIHATAAWFIIVGQASCVMVYTRWNIVLYWVIMTQWLRIQPCLYQQPPFNNTLKP